MFGDECGIGSECIVMDVIGAMFCWERSAAGRTVHSRAWALGPGFGVFIP